MASQDVITRLLKAHRHGNARAADELFALIYQELKIIAHRQLARQRPSETVNTTALVHEAYLKMANRGQDTWVDKAHFLAVAATAMRHILVDYARKQQAEKRGGRVDKTTLDASALAVSDPVIDMLDLDAALTKLAAFDSRLSQGVELRFFGGLSDKEIAHVLGVSTRTIGRDWFKARSFLYLLLNEKDAS